MCRSSWRIPKDTWKQEFRENGGTYRSPKLVIFDGVVASAGGQAAGATGPLYCPNDQKLAGVWANRTAALRRTIE